MVHGLMFRERQVGVAAIHRATGGVHQMHNAVVAAAFEDCAKPHQVALQVSTRIFEGVTHPGLGGQVNHQSG